MSTRLAALATPLLLLTACSEQSTSPAANANTVAVSAARGGAPKFWETGATVAWNELADRLIARRLANAQRVDVYLALAQMRAAQAAEAGNQPRPAGIFRDENARWPQKRIDDLADPQCELLHPAGHTGAHRRLVDIDLRLLQGRFGARLLRRQQ